MDIEFYVQCTLLGILLMSDTIQGSSLAQEDLYSTHCNLKEVYSFVTLVHT